MELTNTHIIPNSNPLVHIMGSIITKTKLEEDT